MAEREKAISRPLHRAVGDYALQMGYRDMIYLNIGEPDFPTPPHIVEAAKKALDDGYTHYTQEKGLPELRRAVAEKMKADRGLEINSENGVLITSGGAEACFVSILSVVDAGDEVIVLDPHYPPYVSAITLASGKPVFVPVNKETLMVDTEKIANHAGSRTKAVVINSPCNPTGMVYGKSMLRAIAEIAVDHDLYVISDEVYERFVYEGERAPSIASFGGMLERTLVVNSFSKTYAMTGWRVGYLAGTPENVSRILKVKGAVNVCASSVSQRAALAALEGPQNCIGKMVGEYAERRRIVLEALKRVPSFKCHAPNGAFYMFPDVSALETDSLKFSKYLVKEAHVVVSPGIGFGPAGEGHIRLSYASSKENLRVALERIQEAVERYGSQKQR